MMKKFLLTVILFSITMAASSQVTWQKLISQNSTDVMRSVVVTTSGNYVVAGYTSNFEATDTNMYVVKFNVSGDTIWTKNFGSNKKDLLYKVRETSDLGLIVCGYSNSYNGTGSDDAYFAKLDSNGNMLWNKVYGTTGKDRAQDIIQTSDGGYAMVGYTSSPGAQYFDAFFVKTNASGDTVFTKIYGGAQYDDANSVKQTSDGGYLMVGQTYSYGAGDGDVWIVKLNSTGDTLWTKTVNNSSVENAEYIAAVTDSTFIIAGGITSGMFGGNDGMLIKIDNVGNILWQKFYGGSAPDDFHTVEVTNDGGFIATGTSTSGGPADPNLWLVRMNATGDTLWQKFFGGYNHDHGYSGKQTPDGGFILCGHTGSFGFNYEEGIVIKTGSNGELIEPLKYASPYLLVAPVNGACGENSALLRVIIRNFGSDTLQNVTTVAQITGFINTTLTKTRNGVFNATDADTITFATPLNTSAGGVLNFHIYTTVNNDVIPSNNTLDTSITINTYSAAPTGIANSRCGTGSVQLQATGGLPLAWFTNSTGGFPIGSGTVFNTPTISSSTTYYVQSGSTCPSTRTAVVATVNSIPAAPATSNAQRCGSGSVTLTATSSSTVNWYDALTGGALVGTGLSFNTPVISSTTTYYAEAVNGSCSSASRTSAIATVNNISADPATSNVSRCGNGTVTLNATSSDTLRWYDAPVGGTLLATSSSYVTPVLSSTTTYYVQAGTICPSNRIAVQAIVNAISSDPVITDTSRCGPGNATLVATAADPVSWYTVSSGGTAIGTGSPFSYFVNVTTTYYAEAGTVCPSSRIPLIVTIDGAAPPSVTDDSSCAAAVLTLTASSSDPIEWYDALTGGNLVGAGPSFTTPLLGSTTSYYAQSINACPSSRVEAVAEIRIINVTPVSNYNCGPGIVNLSASGNAAISWYDAPNGTLLATGNNFSTPSLNNSVTYYVRAADNFCNSGFVQVVATIRNIPSDPVVSGDSNCGAASLSLNATSANNVFWFSQPNAGSQVGSGSNFNTPFLTSTTTYYAQASDSFCTSAYVPVLAEIFTVPDFNFSSDTIASTSIPVLITADPGYTYLWSTLDTTQSISVSDSGVYCVTVSDANGCSDNDCVYVDILLGLNDITSSSFEVYPNPASDMIRINMHRFSNSIIRITSMQGVKVYETEALQSETEISVNDFASGIYLLEVLHDGIKSTQKISVIR